MSDNIRMVYNGRGKITGDDNGSTVTFLLGDKAGGAIQARWNADNAAAPAGTLTPSFDGDPGDPAGVIDLGAGNRMLLCTAPFDSVDIAVSGLPAGATVTVSFPG